MLSKSFGYDTEKRDSLVFKERGTNGNNVFLVGFIDYFSHGQIDGTKATDDSFIASNMGNGGVLGYFPESKKPKENTEGEEHKLESCWFCER